MVGALFTVAASGKAKKAGIPLNERNSGFAGAS
jgi:hypothetical protein